LIVVLLHGSGGETAGVVAVEEIGTPFTGLVVAVVVGTDNYVAVAITVYVAGC
jgi:hypothetical protein